MKYQLQMLMKNEPIVNAMERKLTEIELGIPYEEFDNWLQKKRELGLKKKNKPINRNARRLAIRKKQRFGY